MIQTKNSKRMKKIDRASIVKTNKTPVKFGSIKNSSRGEESNNHWLTFLLLLNSIGKILSQNYLIYVIQHGKGLAVYGCSNRQNLLLHSVRLQKNPADNSPISFNLIDYQAPGTPTPGTFITNADTGNKMYGMYELGSKCYMHNQAEASNTYPFFTLVLKRSATSNSCQVARIITNVGLVPCSGATTDIFSALTLSDGLGTIADFKRIRIQNGFASLYHKPLGVSVANIELSGIDDRIVEMMLLVPFHSVPPDTSTSAIFWDTKRLYNNKIKHNPDLKPLQYSNIIQRITRDDLPGYYLGVYSGEGDDYHKYYQSYFSVINEGPEGIHFNFYLASPQSLVIGQEHKVDILSKMAIEPNRSPLLMQFHYEIRFTRSPGHIEFKTYWDGATLSNTISLPYTGSTDYVYFGFIAAAGILYFKDVSNVKAKVYETLTIYQSGIKLHDLKSYLKDTTAQNIIRNSHSPSSVARLLRVEYIPPVGVTNNEIGVRVYKALKTHGVYPQFLISSRILAGYPKCFYIGYRGNACLSLALLDGPSEASTQHLVDSAILRTATAELTKMCKVPLTTTKCLIPKPGHIGTLGIELRSPLYHSVIPLADYNALSTRYKNFFVEAKNNVGTKYLLTCPLSCGTCDLEMKCLTCPDGSTPQSGACSLSGCMGIQRCTRCSGPGLCSWCSGVTLHPSADELTAVCNTSPCEEGFAYRDPIAKYECVKCSSLKCKTCDPADTCTECKDSTHRLLQKRINNRLPKALTFVGESDCFAPADITDWYYSTATEFKLCKANCKRCSSRTDCQECGVYGDSSAIIYRLISSSTEECLTTCNTAENRAIIPSTTPGEKLCYECSPSTYLLEGSSPPECVPCLHSNSRWVETSTRLCKPCMPGCSICTSGTNCFFCSNPNHYIQVDGGSCGAVCGAREMKIIGSPSRCQSCPSGCSTCDGVNRCPSCDSGYFLSGESCQACPSGCSECTSSTECTRCSNPLHYLQTESDSCSWACKEGETPNKSIMKCEKNKITKNILCPDHCSECSFQQCSICETGFSLIKNQCFSSKSIRFIISQVYAPESNYTFTSKMSLEHQDGVQGLVQNEIDQTMLASKKSLIIYRKNFEIEELEFKISKNTKINEFMIKVELPKTATLAVGQVVEIIVESKKITLNPESYLNRTAELCELAPRLQNAKVEIFKIGVKKPPKLVRLVSDYTRKTTTHAPSVSLGVGVLGLLSSQDPSGLVLRFNQYLDLVRRLIYIGKWLGINLESFMEEMSGREKKEEVRRDKTRLLEISAIENQRDEVASQSMGFHNKLSLYEVSVFFEGPFMIKSILYDISWLLKLVGIQLLKIMKKRGKVVPWRLKFIHNQRKLHFAMILVGLTDILFFSTRIVLHRRNSAMGLAVKTICCLNITLLVIDLLEMLMITIDLNYEKDCEHFKFHQTKLRGKNHRNRIHRSKNNGQRRNWKDGQPLRANDDQKRISYNNKDRPEIESQGKSLRKNRQIQRENRNIIEDQKSCYSRNALSHNYKF